MEPADIIAQPFVQRVADVLRKLEARGLKEPLVATGWTRSLLLDLEPTDIDVSYVGELEHEVGRRHLIEVLDEAGEDPDPWDVNGIWNAQQAYGVEHTEQNILLYGISSIDSVYLAPDGQLHDLTGFGFIDARNRVLRLNTFELENRPRSFQKSVFVAVEACRRIAQFGWRPTVEAEEMVREAAPLWAELLPEKQIYLISRIRKKFQPEDLRQYRDIYAKYGWAFFIDMALEESSRMEGLASVEF